MFPRRSVLCVALALTAFIPALAGASWAPRIVNIAASAGPGGVLYLVCAATTTPPSGGRVTMQDASGPVTITLSPTGGICGADIPMLQGQAPATGTVTFTDVTVALADGSSVTLQRGEPLSGAAGDPPVDQICQVDASPPVLQRAQGCAGPGAEGIIGTVPPPTPAPSATATPTSTFACGTYLTGAMCQDTTATPSVTSTAVCGGPVIGDGASWCLDGTALPSTTATVTAPPATSMDSPTTTATPTQQPTATPTSTNATTPPTPPQVMVRPPTPSPTATVTVGTGPALGIMHTRPLVILPTLPHLVLYWRGRWQVRVQQ